MAKKKPMKLFVSEIHCGSKKPERVFAEAFNKETCEKNKILGENKELKERIKEREEKIRKLKERVKELEKFIQSKIVRRVSRFSRGRGDRKFTID